MAINNRTWAIETGVDRRTVLKGVGGAFLAPMLSMPSAAYSAPTKGGQIVIASWPAPTYLTSSITTDAPEIALGTKLFDGLLEYDFGMKPKPGLATGWKMSDDGKMIEFTLRRDVRWHDGEPFTSRDVAFTLMKIAKVLHGRGRITFEPLREVDATDPHVAIFHLDRSTPAVMKSLDSRETPIMPAHLYDGTDIMQNPHNLKPVGTGPWKLTEYRIGESVILDRNPDYWDSAAPNLDRIALVYISDAATRTAMLETGAVDMVPYSLIPYPDLNRLKDAGGFDITTKGYETLSSIQFAEFNLRNPILQNVDVRRAIAHAIDTSWIAENVWLGYSVAATGPVHPDHVDFYTTDDVPAYAPSLEKAEELLDSAGYPRKADGIRFSLNVVPSPNGTEPLQAAEYMREQFRRIGIDASIYTSDAGAFVQRVYHNYDFDLSILNGSTGADPAIGMHRFYHSANIKQGVAFSNASGFSNAEADELLNAAQSETDTAKRAKLYADFQRLIMTELPVLPLIACNRVTIANVRLKDHTVDAFGAFGSMKKAFVES